MGAATTHWRPRPPSLVNAARAAPGLTSVYTPFSISVPQLFVEVDRTRAEMLNVAVARVTEAIETYFGSAYVNDFNVLGRTYRVTAQADLPFRTQPEDLMRLRAQNEQGQMVPLGSLLKVSDITAADRVAALQPVSYRRDQRRGDPRRELGRRRSPPWSVSPVRSFPKASASQWTDLAYQQTTEGNAGLLVFPLSVLFVYLVLAAQYGSWSLPLAIILIVPMCLLSAHIRRTPLRAGHQHPHADRLRGAGGAGQQERHPHRGVRAAARSAGARPGRRGGRGLPAAAAADPDDLVRLHPGCAAPDAGGGRRGGDAPGGRAQRCSSACSA